MDAKAKANDARFDAIISALDCCDSIQEQLEAVDSLNNRLNDDFTNVIQSASKISTTVLNSNLLGNTYQLLVNHADELEQILRLPEKLDSAIDDPKRFVEAVDMLEKINVFYKNHGHQMAMLSKFHQQAVAQRKLFISNLCNRLESVSNPWQSGEALTIVNCLMGCGGFSDRELRLRYLQARDNWFKRACEEKSSYFDEVVSVYSEGIQMIFNEYKSIFGQTAKTQIRSSSMTNFILDDSQKEDGAIINSWLLLKASIFIASLEIYLKTVTSSGMQTPTMLGDTMAKCVDLTSWLSSIGFDFNAQLRPIFSQAILAEIKTSLERSTVKFEVAFAAAISKSVEALLLPVEDEILRISNIRTEDQLPKSIEHYPIFRVHCLYLLDSLRWLKTPKKLISPIQLCNETYANLNLSLVRVVKALSLILNTDGNSNHPILTKIAISLITEVVPFFKAYCERLFPEKVILNSIGITKADLYALLSKEPESIRNLCLDPKRIAEPLRTTMPALVQTLDD